MVRNEGESPHHWAALLVGIFRLMASCLLAEYLHTQTILKFDEAARDLEKLEGTTRKEVCAAVKAFNMNQVHTPCAQSEGKDVCAAASRGLLEF